MTGKMWDGISSTMEKQKLKHLQECYYLDAIMLPNEVAACNCAAHTKKIDDVSKVNDFAEKTAKEAAQGQFELIATLQEVPQPIDKTVLKDMQQHARKSEKDYWKNKVAIENNQGFFCDSNRKTFQEGNMNTTIGEH